MKLVLFSLLTLIVSFLAIRPAFAEEKDEFAEFEFSEKAPVKTKETKKAAPPRSIEELKAAIRKDPRNIKLIEELSSSLIKEGHQDKAAKLLWKYVDQISDTYLLELSRIELDKKDFAQAIRAATLLTGRSPQNAEAWTLLGKSQSLNALPAESLESFKQAITANPKLEEPYWELIKYYEKKKNLYEVRILVQDLMEAQGPRPLTRQKLCEVNYNDESYEAGVQTCKEASLKDPEESGAYVYLGLSYLATGEKEKAATQLKKAANRFKNSEAAQYHYANFLKDEKNHLDSAKYFRSAVAADPESARSWLGLGTESFEIQKYDEALTALSKACKFKRFEAATQLRKSLITLRSTKNLDMTRKFELAAESCQFQ